MDKIYRNITKFLDSRKFLWLIIAFFVLNALWIACSFRYPMIYDEIFHLPLIKQYATQLSPYLTEPPKQFPFHIFGFHYLMSWPYRVIAMLTNNFMIQVIFLRIINIAVFATGLVVFARLFRKISIRQSYINIGLLLFILLPITPFIAAHINYDNMLFLLTAIYMLTAVNIIQEKRVNWRKYVVLISLGLIASLVKFQFLPIFAISVLYLVVIVWRRYGKSFLPAFWLSLRKTGKFQIAAVSLFLAISLGLFSAEYVRSIIIYGTPTPKCTQVHNLDSCLKSGVIRRNITAYKTRGERAVKPLGDFTHIWVQNMTKVTLWTGGNTFPDDIATTRKGLPIVQSLFFFGSIAGLAVLLYAWRSLKKEASWYFLTTMVMALFLSVYLLNMQDYYRLHAAFANQPRYFLSLIPVLMVMIVAATAFALRKYRWIKLFISLSILLTLTQGGGAVIHILRSEDNWYWQNPKVFKANHMAKKMLRPIVKESPIFR